MSVITNNLLLGEDGYNISRSVRLRSSASAYFSRTPGSTTNRQIMTWSGWVKRGSLSDSGYMYLFGAYPGSSATDTINFINGTLRVWFNGSSSADLVTTQVFRDPSAWYHIVVAIDTTQATSSNRIKVYVNGSQITSFSTASYPTQNYNTYWNNSSYSNQLGANGNGPASFFDGYLTEINFIDGQALTPSSFGETDLITGVWKPKKYTGTYGTNGFFLNFSDPSAATAAAIGKDYSGNGNNWTPNNISVTAGVTYDSMIDVPTMSGAGSNHCTLNPVGFTAYRNARATYANANLQLTADATSNSYEDYTGTIGISSGKWYWEMTNTNAASGTYSGFGAGIAWSSSVASVHLNQIATGGGLQMAIYKNNSSSQTSLGVTANSDVYGIALDLDNLTCQFYKNGSTLGSQVTGLTAGQVWLPMGEVYPGSNSHIYNFGQRPFAYTPPTGFKALNTQNLPDATVKKGNAFFDVLTYTGNGATQTISGLNFQPDLVWGKARSDAIGHNLFDAVRGGDRQLISNTTAAETVRAGNAVLFNSNGITLDATYCNINNNAVTNVAWNWKESVTAGFDIVTYTGTGVARTVNHSLGVAPNMMIVKNRTTSIAGAWTVYHSAMASPASSYLFLELTDGRSTTATPWNGTAPTSSVFSVDGSNRVNQSGNSFVAYLFSEVAGYSKFGSYTGNGSADGPFVYCGFRPRFVMVKRTDTTGNWYILDTSRNSGNVENLYLQPQSSAAEGTYTFSDYLSNGFKLRDNSADWNASSGTFIFAAFAENPFKNSLAR